MYIQTSSHDTVNLHSPRDNSGYNFILFTHKNNLPNNIKINESS